MPITTSIPGYCTLCRSRCGTLNHVANDRLIKVEALEGHPTGRGTCAKGRAAPELVDHPDRLLYPLKRTRPKGSDDPGWVRIGWDEALDEIASRLRELRDRYGAESVAFSVTTPSGTPMSDSIEWVERFIRHFGSPNTIYGTEICNWHKDVAHAFTFGSGMPNADYANARLAILWGHNPSHVWLSQAGELGAGQQNGTRLLVIDPRETAHARQADLWLAPHPGTDGALALAIANQLLISGHIDEDFVRRWSNAPFLVDDDTGRWVMDPQAPDCYLAWDLERQTAVAIDTRKAISQQQAEGLALEGTRHIRLFDGSLVRCRPAMDHYRQACAAWPLDRAARETGLSENSILKATALIANAGQHVAYHGWTGIGQHINATQTERAIATLYALTGSFDRPGGNRLWATPAINRINDHSLLDETQRAKALGLDERPLGPAASGWVTAEAVYDAIEHRRPYPVKALFGFGGNFLLSQPNPQQGERALRQLDFHVHCDLFHTPTNAFADILLPINTPWERDALRTGFEINAAAACHMQFRPAMISARGESRADYQVALDLACRLGMADDFFGGDIEKGWQHMLQPSGLDLETLRRSPAGVSLPLTQSPRRHTHVDEQGNSRGFDTPTRRVELYSQRLHDHGYPAVPRHLSPSTTGTSRWPMTLVTVKNGLYCHSQQRNLVSLRRRTPDPGMALSPTTAKCKGLVEGGWGTLVSEHGEVTLRVAIDASLRDNLVIADYGWWQACDDLGRSDYTLHGHGSANINALISSARRDPLSGSLALRSAPCDVRQTIQHTAWSGYRSMRISERRGEAEDTTSLWLEPVDGGLLPSYLPGQHVTLRFNVAGQETVRSYSLSGAAHHQAQPTYRITVKRIAERDDQPAGVVSHLVNRELNVGDRVDMQMPAGHFTLPRRHARPVVLIAGGIGITPFMSLLESLAHSDAEHMPAITLVYANRNGRQHAFKRRLIQLAKKLPRLKVINLYSEASDAEAASGDCQHIGHISPDILDPIWLTQRARFYLCGPQAMMDDLRQWLEQCGVRPFEIFHESFVTPRREMKAPVRPRTVRLQRSKREYLWQPAQGTLLESAAAHGIELPSGCRVGQCESCALSLIEGQVHSFVETPFLDPHQCLTCQAIPLSDIVLDA
ncbi:MULTISPECIES: molybdopterin-dependent oxidoreductase [Halomonadaceae]|uniref:molybdopterin-dependent oxidoreductase n=1 Tax=Halomonadaceae TaxID=28256 RepID=UPI00159792A8|nr:MULTISPECIES: molybdopterin-dependent oxidoreductase [Halomonas]QJQ96338.1 molybdopterin-dependent oxidoreductase [Halomonas sp. PA5]